MLALGVLGAKTDDNGGNGRCETRREEDRLPCPFTPLLEERLPDP